MEWKELTKRDAQQSLEHEMDKLLLTSTASASTATMRTEFDGFRKLFNKFIHETGPSVHWERIEKLPQNAVTSSCKVVTIVTIL